MKVLSFDKIAFVIILILSFKNVYCQSKRPLEIGIGASTGLPYAFSNTDYYSLLPDNPPIGPTINLKHAKHEAIVGIDFYRVFTQAHYRIAGIQAAYRYHFYRENKKANMFLDCNLQYVQFSVGTGIAVPYNYSQNNSNENSLSIYKSQSLFNSYGLGIELPFLEYFSFYTSLGVGFNYLHTNIDYSGDLWFTPENHPDRITPIANLRLGLTCRLYKKKSE